MKKIMLFLAVAGIMAACNNDNEVVNEPQYITEFKAVFGGADSRIAAEASAAGLKFSWEEGDILYVYNPSDENDYFEYKYNSTSGIFVLESASKTDGGMTVNEAYFATTQILYDGSYTTVDGDFAVKTQLYYGEASTIPLISGLFLAKADGTIAPMHHTVGVVEIPVKLGAGSTITELGGVGIYKESAHVIGEFYATPESPYYAGIIEDGEFFEDSSTWQGATLNESTPVSFFIPMLPGEYTNPSLFFANEDGDYVTDEVQLTGTLTIECGKVTRLPEQVLTLSGASGPSSGDM